MADFSCPILRDADFRSLGNINIEHQSHKNCYFGRPSLARNCPHTLLAIKLQKPHRKKINTPTKKHHSLLPTPHTLKYDYDSVDAQPEQVLAHGFSQPLAQSKGRSRRWPMVLGDYIYRRINLHKLDDVFLAAMADCKQKI